MTRLLSILLIIAFLSVSPAAHAGAVAISPVERIAALVPDDALAAVVVPHLRAANDELTHALEAMDRGHILLGTRALDLIKTTAGFPIAIDERGGVALIVMPAAEGGPDGLHDNLLAIIAVTDADAFLRGNFREAAAHPEIENLFEITHRRWGALYARPLGDHVAMSPRIDIVADLRGVDGEAPFTATRLGADGLAIARQGNVFAYVKRDLMDILDIIPPELARAGVELPKFHGLDRAVFSVDFDPLGFFVRSHLRFDESSDQARALAALGPRAASQTPLMRVPKRAYILALGADLSRLTPEVVEAMPLPPPLAVVARSLAGVESAQLMIAASPVGPRAGLLNDASLIVRGRDGDASSAALQRLIEAGGEERTSVVWRRDVPVSDAGRADAYEVRLVAPEMTYQLFIQQLFGPAGMRGYFGREGASVFITFSQRTATLLAAREAAAETAPPLADDHVIRSLQSWLSPQRDIEAYFDPGEVQAFTMVGRNVPVDVEGFRRGQPPIGVSIRFEGAGVENVLILPSNVLVPFVDNVGNELKRRATMPAPPEAQR